MSESVSEVRGVFQRRARAFPADLRRSWRVPLILLLVDSCWGHSATRTQLHVLGSALLRPDVRTALTWLMAGGIPDWAPIRFDPALERAIDLAVGSELLTEQETGRLVLTESGSSIVDQIRSDETVLRSERDAIERLPRRFTHTDAAQLLRSVRT